MITLKVNSDILMNFLSNLRRNRRPPFFAPEVHVTFTWSVGNWNIPEVIYIRFSGTAAGLNLRENIKINPWKIDPLKVLKTSHFVLSSLLENSLPTRKNRTGTQVVFCVSLATEIPPDLHVFNKSTERDCKQAEINGCCLGGERRKSQVRIKKSKHLCVG